MNYDNQPKYSVFIVACFMVKVKSWFLIPKNSAGQILYQRKQRRQNNFHKYGLHQFVLYQTKIKSLQNAWNIGKTAASGSNSNPSVPEELLDAVKIYIGATRTRRCFNKYGLRRISPVICYFSDNHFL